MAFYTAMGDSKDGHLGVCAVHLLYAPWIKPETESQKYPQRNMTQKIPVWGASCFVGFFQFIPIIITGFVLFELREMCCLQVKLLLNAQDRFWPVDCSHPSLVVNHGPRVRVALESVA